MIKIKWDEKNRAQCAAIIRAGDAERLQHFYMMMLPAYFPDTSFWIDVKYRRLNPKIPSLSWVAIFRFFEAKGRILFERLNRDGGDVARQLWYETIASGYAELVLYDEAKSLIEEGVNYCDQHRENYARAQIRVCAARIFYQAKDFKRAMSFCENGLILSLSDDSFLGRYSAPESLTCFEELHFKLLQTIDHKISDDGQKLGDIFLQNRKSSQNIYTG